MAIALDKHFVAAARETPFELTFGEGRHVVVRRSDQPSGNLIIPPALLEVVEDDVVKGYITSYSDREHGAVQPHLFGRLAPRLFDTLEGALRELL